MGADGSPGGPSIAIIGAGFGGLGLAMRLKRAGIESFTLLEKGDGVGGVWRDNTYPGLTCDVPSHLYSFSFEPNHDWSRRFPPQQEILAYLERCAAKHGLYEKARFGIEVAGAAFDAGTQRWRIETTAGEGIEAQVLVTATGQLSRPAYPALPGLERFAGRCFHSADWDHDYELGGRQVAVVGTGASAIQFIPRVAREAARLHVFQRSAPWVVPKPDRPYPRWERALYRRLPAAQSLSRLWDYLVFELLVLALIRHQWLIRPYERRFERQLEAAVADDRLRALLRPDHPMGCKRVLLSSDYHETMTRPGVELVTAPISEVREDRIVTADGAEREVDAIILGTGFRTTEFLSPMRIAGADGRELNEVWSDGAEAYLGLTVAGFPNLFMLYGPNTNLGANSIIFMLESQIGYVIEAVRGLRRTGATSIEVREEVQRAFNADVQRRLAGSVWQAGCRSWYLTESGRNTNNWPGTTLEYRRRTRRPNLAEYRVRLAA